MLIIIKLNGDIMKICVYAICKNEEKFVERWYNSMKEADEIYVLDTGSDDNTVKLLKKYGVNVKSEIIKPWRFDVARNKSLEMVPKDTDICVCTDLDEVFLPGWRKILEDNYKTNYRVYYTYNWHINEKGEGDVTFLLNNIHPRENYHWLHPVHEVLTCKNNEQSIIIPEIVLNHFPDKTKSRASYLELLELSVKEDPLDDRNMHYLGREYMYYQKWEECINTLKKHLELKRATWNLERAASMRYIARSYINLHNDEEAIYWYKLAIKEAPNVREAYTELGFLYNSKKQYLESIYYLLQALTIKEKELIYINEVFCWNGNIEDIMSLNYYYIGLYDISLFYLKKALKYKENDERILNNKKIILEALKKEPEIDKA